MPKLSDRFDMAHVVLVRAWVLLLLGSALIIYGLVKANGQSIFVGFAVLGSESIVRSKALNGLNGK